MRSRFATIAIQAVVLAASSVSMPTGAGHTGRPLVARIMRVDAARIARAEAISTPVASSPSPSTLTGGGSLTYSVTVSSPAGSGAYIWVNCAQPGLVSPPTGSWPYKLSIPDGATSASCTLTTSQVTRQSSATIGSCESDYNPNDQQTWQSSCGVTVTP